ncbi:hypothetical protein EV426DRAFT_529259, partial [Tirmania nivea]
YNVNHYVNISLYPVFIKCRGIRNNEQLHFSRLSSNNWCGNYLYSTKPVSPLRIIRVLCA